MTDKPTERAAMQHPPPRDIVDETSEASFPASDPPSWGPLRVGTPHETLASAAAISTPTRSYAIPRP